MLLQRGGGERLLLDRHLWGLAAQPLHTERGLDVSQIQFDVPAVSVKHLKFVLGCHLGVQDSRYHDLTTGLELTYYQR